MKSLTFLAVVAAKSPYRVVSWNLVGLLSDRYEFHSVDNKDFIKFVEDRLENIIKKKDQPEQTENKPDPEFDKLMLAIACKDTKPEPIARYFYQSKDVTNWASPEEAKTFYDMIGVADKYMKSRPTYDKTNEEVNKISTIQQYTDEWVKYYQVKVKETIKKIDGTTEYIFKSTMIRKVPKTDQKDEGKNQAYICKSLVNLYVRDVFLFQARIDFQTKGGKILESWGPADMENKLKELSENYGDITDIFALQEAVPVILNDVMLTKQYFKGFKMLVHPTVQEWMESNAHDETPKNEDEEKANTSVLLLRESLFNDFDLKVLSQSLQTSERKIDNQKEVVVVATGKGETIVQNIIIASFHADGDGKDTQPFLKNLAQHRQTMMDDEDKNFEVVVGLDANSIAPANKERSDGNPLFTEFEKNANSLGFVVGSINTTETSKKSRTILQSQIKKGFSLAEADTVEGDRKDHVLFMGDNEALACSVDNTYEYRYESRYLPYNKFLSDHAIVYCGAKLPVPKTGSRTSTTQPDQKKSSSHLTRNILIAVLVLVIIAVPAYFLYAGKRRAL